MYIATTCTLLFYMSNVSTCESTCAIQILNCFSLLPVNLIIFLFYFIILLHTSYVTFMDGMNFLLDGQIRCQFFSFRNIPPDNYNAPEHPQSGVISKAAVLTAPFCPYNSCVMPMTLDYLPMPWNLSERPHDPRLISGYQL